MKYDLEPAKNVLRTFLKDIDELKEFRSRISPPVLSESFSFENKEPIFDASKITSAPDSY